MCGTDVSLEGNRNTGLTNSYKTQVGRTSITAELNFVMLTQLNIYLSPLSVCLILISTRWHYLSAITKYFHAGTDPENHGSQHQFQRNFTNNCKAPLCECVVIDEKVFVRYGICIIATQHMSSSSLVTYERSNKLPSTSFAVLTNL